MKNLYKLDRLSVLGTVLISILIQVIQMILTDPNVSEMPQMGKWLKLLIYVIGAVLAFAIAYWLFNLLLKNNDNYKAKLIINMAIGLTIEACLMIIVFLIAGKTNIWIKGIVGVIGFGSMAGLNWKFLEVSQSDKIKISVLTAIWFILTLF
ncbi:hypothetical protein [Companilactobacillus heilongjiangensis]|uniref:Uncharacterized protein n=1 Tax=Companilactobacillus heilongjiangensis TaxID=1074467 RepID=A0A0K2LF29_9LACO|nr:hypothetical protein [Companilactobacillus heilongjiangensis]ALB29904.1 hypothetical protein JP39_11355 [Companilactobacillus heilongjiangensis]